MTLQQLRYLLAVAESGSITAAAESLYVAQPALSRGLRALERELSLELLSREGRGVGLTPAGVRVVRLARAMIDIARAIEEIGRPGRGSRGEINIAATPTMIVDFTARILPAFENSCPEVHVRISRFDNREELIESVRTGQADIGIVDLPVPDEVKAHRLHEHEVVLISPHGIDLPNPLPMRLLDGLELVLPQRGGGRRAEFETMFTIFGVKPVPVIETAERSAWIAAVLTGQASLLWYRELAAGIFGDAVAIRSLEPPIVRTIGLIHSRRPLSPQARMFEVLALPPSAYRKVEVPIGCHVS